MPPSTATSEISFSVLKRVKKHLRATMGQEWLWAWSLPHIHIDIQLPLHAFVDKFNNTRQNKTPSAWLYVNINYIINMIKEY